MAYRARGWPTVILLRPGLQSADTEHRCNVPVLNKISGLVLRSTSTDVLLSSVCHSSVFKQLKDDMFYNLSGVSPARIIWG